ncbi:MAG: hypothetical protein V1708_02745 [Candidatus Micrarchaeota archaeon]
MKRVIAAAVVAAILFLSGCVTMQYGQKFESDGSSRLTYSVDFSKALALIKKQGESSLSYGRSSGQYVNWNMRITYHYSNKTYPLSTGYISGYLSDNSSAASGNYCSASSFKCGNVVLSQPNARLAFDLTGFYSNESIFIDDVNVSGKGAPTRCTFPARIDGSLMQGSTISGGQVVCTGISMPTPTPTPDPVLQYESKISGLCANITAANPGVECQAKGINVTVSKSFANGDGYKFTTDYGFPYIHYRVKVESLPYFLKNASSGLFGSSSYDYFGTGSAYIDQDAIDFSGSPSLYSTLLAAYGLKIKYSVSMPGSITKAEGGDIGENTANFNVLKLVDDEKLPVVESRELNLPYIAFAAVGALVVAAAAFFYYRHRQPPAAAMAAGAAQEKLSY